MEDRTVIVSVRFKQTDLNRLQHIGKKLRLNTSAVIRTGVSRLLENEDNLLQFILGSPSAMTEMLAGGERGRK